MRRLTAVKTIRLLVVAVVATTTRLEAGTVVSVPPSLDPGDQYRLVFVTNGTTAASSSNIADYNAFVTSEANANPALAALGATWMVIGSTGAVSAALNIGLTTSRVFNLGGQEVATSTSGLLTTLPLLAPVDITSTGDIHEYSFVWTGMWPDRRLGQSSADTEYGAIHSDYGWLTAGSSSIPGYFDNNSLLPLYAISSEITATPEPTTVGQWALGGAALLLVARRRHRQDLMTA